MNHYETDYFNWQKGIGVFGGKVELFKFEEHIKIEDRVIEFGCGGGYLLSALKCSGKIGIEINDFARKYAQETHKLKVVKTIEEIENNWADVIISNHALEHTYDPLNILLKLSTKIKTNGLIIIVVPQEFGGKFHVNDINHHLFTWTPLTLGNLFSTAGLEVVSSKTIINRWPPYYELIYNLVGKYFFNLISTFYCFISRKGYQVKTIGVKTQ